MTAPNRVDELRKRYHESPKKFFAPFANELRKTGQIERALLILQKHLGEQATSMNGLVVYGQCLFEIGRLEEAKGPFEAALGLDPENLIALRHLGDIARLGGDLDGARAWYGKVLELDRRNDEVLALMAELGGGEAREAPVVPPANLVSVASSVSVAPAEPARPPTPPAPRPSVAPPPPVVGATPPRSRTPVDPSARTVEVTARPQPPRRASLLDVSFDFGELPAEAPSAPAPAAPPVAARAAVPPTPAATPVVEAPIAAASFGEVAITPEPHADLDALLDDVSTDAGGLAGGLVEEAPLPPAPDVKDTPMFAPLVEAPPEGMPLAEVAPIDGIEKAEFSAEVSPLAGLEAHEFQSAGADDSAPVDGLLTPDFSSTGTAPLDGLETSEFEAPADVHAGGLLDLDEADEGFHAMSLDALSTVPEPAPALPAPEEPTALPAFEEPEALPTFETPVALPKVEAPPALEAPSAGGIEHDSLDHLLDDDLGASPTADLPLLDPLGTPTPRSTSPVHGIPLLPPLEDADTVEIDVEAVRRGMQTPKTFVTETMAEVYVQQGHTDKAIDVYRQLIAQAPEDAGLKARLAALEATLPIVELHSVPEAPSLHGAKVTPPLGTPAAGTPTVDTSAPTPVVPATPVATPVATPRLSFGFETPVTAEAVPEPNPPANAMLSEVSFEGLSLSTPVRTPRSASPVAAAPAVPAEPAVPAGPTAREFFGRFARRGLAPATPAASPAVPTPTAGLPLLTPSSAVPSVAGGPLSPLDALFGVAVDEADERAAHRLASIGATSGPSGGSALDSLFGEGPSAPMPPELRAAADTPTRPSVPRASDTLRFDQFFASSLPAATPSAPRTPVEAAPAAAAPAPEPEPELEVIEEAGEDEDDDLDQFQGWLRGLTQ